MISYTAHFIPANINIYGVGGTGSRLVPLIAQFIKTCSWVTSPKIMLFDPDVVEEKNLLRQNFVKPDVGKPKAEVLARRYSAAFGCDILPIVHEIVEVNPPYLVDSSSPYLETLRAASREDTIHILCVDSPRARRNIISYIFAICGRGTKNNLIIDSGNENNYGQIVVGNSQSIRDLFYLEDVLKNALPLFPIELDLPVIPFDRKYFAEMKEVSKGSCADLDQTMAINSLMATTIFGIIQNFYYAKPISFNRLNVSLDYGTTPEYLTINTLRRIADYEDKMVNYSVYTDKSGNIESFEPLYLQNFTYAYFSSAQLEKLSDEIIDFNLKLGCEENLEEPVKEELEEPVKEEPVVVE